MVFICLILYCLSCAKKEFSYSRFLVGGLCEVKFYHHNEKEAKRIISEIDLELIRIDSLLNRFSEKSLISRLNKERKIQAPEDIVRLFLLSDSIARLTDGTFDISIAPLLELWGFYENNFKIPDTAEIERVKKLVDYSRIQIRGDSIILPQRMKVDLSGIAQGYAADRVADIIKGHGINSALINIGGEMVLVGRSSKNRPWRIGIRNPRGKGIIEVIEITNGALSTSGDYEKFFMVEGTRYPHIIDPRTGFPAMHFVSVTILAKSAAFADAIATAVAVMGPEKGMNFLDSLKIRGIMYYEENGELQRVETE